MLGGVLVVFALLGGVVALYRTWMGRSWRRLQTATNVGDLEAARVELRWLKKMYRKSPRTLNSLALTEAWLLVE